MKKGLKITLLVVGSLIAVFLLLLAVIYLSGNVITIARCVPTENGGIYMVYNDRPVHLNYRKDIECEIGDKYLIIHSSAFAESYPEQTRTVFMMRIGDGKVEDIPDKVFNTLYETGNNVEYNENNIEFVLDTPTKELESRFAAEYSTYKGYDEFNIGPVEIEYWFGRYGNIGFAYPRVGGLHSLTVECTTKVAGYTFVYPTPQEIVVWVGDKFITIKEAYEQGLIPEEVVGKLAELWADRKNLKK